MEPEYGNFDDDDDMKFVNQDETPDDYDPDEEEDDGEDDIEFVTRSTIDEGPDAHSSWRKPTKNKLCSISVTYRDETTTGKYRVHGAADEKQVDKFPLPDTLLALLVTKVKRHHTVEFKIEPKFWEQNKNAIPGGVEKDTSEDTLVKVKVVEIHDEDDIGLGDKPLMKTIEVAGEGYDGIIDDSSATFEFSIRKKTNNTRREQSDDRCHR